MSTHGFFLVQCELFIKMSDIDYYFLMPLDSVTCKERYIVPEKNQDCGSLSNAKHFFEGKHVLRDCLI